MSLPFVHRLNNRIAQRGTSLLEVLVALSLCGFIGLVMAKSLVLSLHRTMDHKLEVLAQTLAQDFIERTYANRPAALAGRYTLSGTTSVQPLNCAGRPCTSESMAAYDLSTWLNMHASSLPDSKVLVQFLNGRYTLAMAWFPRVSGPAATECIIDLAPDQRCLQLEWDV